MIGILDAILNNIHTKVAGPPNIFNIIPNIIIDESLDKSKENYAEKDNNFMSIPIKSGFEKYEN